jgi:hypothetical protein
VCTVFSNCYCNQTIAYIGKGPRSFLKLSFVQVLEIRAGDPASRIVLEVTCWLHPFTECETKGNFLRALCTKVWVGYKWFFWPCLVAIQSFNKAQIAVNWISRLMNNVLWFDSMGISVILRALFSCFLCGTMWCCLQSDWPKLSYLVLFQHITCNYVSKQWAKMC